MPRELERHNKETGSIYSVWVCEKSGQQFKTESEAIVCEERCKRARIVRAEYEFEFGNGLPLAELICDLEEIIDAEDSGSVIVEDLKVSDGTLVVVVKCR